MTFMNQLCCNFRCQFVRIVFNLNTHRDEIVRYGELKADRRLAPHSGAGPSPIYLGVDVQGGC